MNPTWVDWLGLGVVIGGGYVLVGHRHGRGAGHRDDPRRAAREGVMTWHIEASVGNSWETLGGAFRDLTVPLALLRHLTRVEQLDAYRCVDSEGRVVVSITPGCRGAA